MAATERCLPVVRSSVRRWLAGLGWPDDPAEDIVLAVHEAVSNAIEHAYPDSTVNDPAGLITVRGVVETQTPDTPRGPPRGSFPHEARRVRLSIHDDGRWQSDRHDRSDPARARGRGLTMMQALMTEMTITADTETGTQVELLSKPISR